MKTDPSTFLGMIGAPEIPRYAPPLARPPELPHPTICPQCKFGSGLREGSVCSVCCGRGTVYQVRENFYPDTSEGRHAALGALWGVRMWMIWGWVRWRAHHEGPLREAMRMIQNRRSRGNWAILVEDDDLALTYQAAHFRIERARYAFGEHGHTGRASLGAEGVDDADAIHESQRQSIARLRERAVLYARLPKPPPPPEDEDYAYPR